MKGLVFAVMFGFVLLFWTGVAFLCFEYNAHEKARAFISGEPPVKKCESQIAECRAPTGVVHTARYKIEVKKCPIECI